MDSRRAPCRLGENGQQPPVGNGKGGGPGRPARISFPRFLIPDLVSVPLKQAHLSLPVPGHLLSPLPDLPPLPPRGSMSPPSSSPAPDLITPHPDSRLFHGVLPPLDSLSTRPPRPGNWPPHFFLPPAPPQRSPAQPSSPYPRCSARMHF